MGYVGRFAPSPTGPLHYGSLVAALASFLDARHENGVWLLRIEDLDPPRETVEAPAEIIKQLRAYGLHWDGEILYQSSRLDAYDKALTSLDEQTFRCVCTRNQTPPIYPGTCRGISVETGKPSSVRLQIDTQDLSFDDLVLGHQYWPASEVGDFIIRRKDGLHAYQLAVVIDDIHQDITHIVRGADLLDSTPKQIALYRALSETLPEYLHLPVLVDVRGDKLSKQSHAKPLSTDSPLNTLNHALRDLGQSSIPNAQHVDALLKAATASWNRNNIPKTPTIQAPATLR